MQKPQDIQINKYWSIKFYDDAHTPVLVVYSEYGREVDNATWHCFLEIGMTSGSEEVQAPESVYNKIKSYENLMCAWENEMRENHPDYQ
ncbi:MAG TPA: hypothetical protein VK172_10330 [Lentimicrobium sp.]|nr:hypothetical protein [Lentimicrobium sp.]